METGEIPLKHKKKWFCHEDSQGLEQVAQKGCRFASCGDVQNPGRYGPWQSAQADPAVSSVVGRDGLQRFFLALKAL